jgi:aminoglycoside 3-N-acetyltransferase
VHSRKQLTEDVRALGVMPGDCIMVHASLRAVGEVAGGPDQVHLALKDALTPDGTLIMYAGCPRYYDEVGRGNLTPEEEREVLDKLPPFDPETARSARDHGALVELLRTSPGSRVNHHVTRFVVWGRQAEYLISYQPWNYALGAGSVLERLVELDGKILLLGCDHDTVTFLHYAEHVVDIPDKRIARYRVSIEENGRRVWRDQEEVDSSDRAHANWPDRFFAKITDGYLAAHPHGRGRVGNADSYLLSANGLLCFALPLMRAVAADAHAAEGLEERFNSGRRSA